MSINKFSSFQAICTRCKKKFSNDTQQDICKCGGDIEFIFKLKKPFNKIVEDREDMWRYKNLLPINMEREIISFGEGFTRVERAENLEPLLNNAKLYLKVESENPTGTFKDREGSLIISRNNKLRENLVFHTTGNTGRSYNKYCSKIKTNSFCFLPLSSMYKFENSLITDKNFVIAINGAFQDVSPVSKIFSKKNDFSQITSKHEKIEPYTTIAYEQFEQLPSTTMYVQTLSSGYGPLGFLKGHQRLVKNGDEKKSNIPKIVCIQSEDNNNISQAYNFNNLNLLKKYPKTNPFEHTLQSSDPSKNFNKIAEVLNSTNGLITDVNLKETENIKEVFDYELKRLNIHLDYEKEKSAFIAFAGIKKLANKGKIKSNETILLMITGRGKLPYKQGTPSAVLRAVSLENYSVEEVNNKKLNKLLRQYS